MCNMGVFFSSFHNNNNYYYFQNGGNKIGLRYNYVRRANPFDRMHFINNKLYAHITKHLLSLSLRSNLAHPHIFLSAVEHFNKLMIITVSILRH
jgi:hypothetical protein